MNSRKFALAFSATGLCMEILSLMAETDLVMELRFICEQQFNLFSSMVDAKDFPPYKIKVFENYINEMRRNIDEINDAKGQ